MIIKGYTNYAIVFNYFFAKEKERTRFFTGGNIFYEEDKLYSYGRHFPLAVRCRNGYILNGDRYSNTTSGHQSLTRSMAENHNKETTNRKTHHCIIPFSALHAAGIELEDVTIVDVTDDSYETVKRRNPKTGEIEEHRIHHLGASLIRRGTMRYLSSIDSSSRRHSYYLVELRSRRVNKVVDGYRDLAANLNDEQYSKYLLGDIRRQGEYFLEPHSELSTMELKRKARKIKTRLRGVLKIRVKTQKTKEMIKDLIRRDRLGYGGIAKEQVRVMRQDGIPYYIVLTWNNTGLKIPKDVTIENNSIVVQGKLLKNFDLNNGDGNHHLARDVIQTLSGLYIRGTLRHPEHRMIRMGNIWHKVYKNTAVNSWSADGNVD
jgi:hypothetical protein